MKKYGFKFIACSLIFFHLASFCLQDLSFAETTASQSNSSKQAAAPAASASADTPAKSNAANQPDSPAAQPASSSQNKSKAALQSASSPGAGSSSTLQQTNVAGLNLAALSSFQNDPFTGRAVFSLPIAAPSGRRGIQPNLALTYSSGSGNGILGLGWALELGSIERSTKKGVPQYNSQDTFIFNSAGSSSELTRLEAGPYAGEYRAKIEGAFLRFKFNGASWVVTDKSGSKYFFGQDSSSRTEDGSRVFKWALNKVIDLNGNYLTLTYIKDAGQAYLKAISYTANENTNLSPQARIDFDWEDNRSDVLLSYRPGFKLLTAKRLKGIRVSFREKPLSRYHLAYTYSSAGQSLLSAVTQFGADDLNHLPPVTFTYQSQEPGWELSNKRLPDKYGSFDWTTTIIDVNNDSFPDILTNNGHNLYLAAKDGSYQETAHWRFPGLPTGITNGAGDCGYRFLDLNNDGWVDIINHVHSDGGGRQPASVYLNNQQNAWEYNAALSQAFPCDAYFIFNHHFGPQEWHSLGGFILADANADGLVDILEAGGDGHRVYLATGSGWQKTVFTTPLDISFTDGSTQVGDLNADGLIDLVFARAERKAAYLNTGSSWQREPSFDPPNDSQIDFVNGSTQLVDINSDGLADLLVAKGSTRRAFLNKGGSWQEDSAFALPAGDFSNQKTRLADLRGTGFLDILINENSSQNKVYTSRQPLPPGYLVKVSNGIGGELLLSYKPSTQFDNTASNGTSGLPFPVYVVDTVTLRDLVNTTNPDIVSRYGYKGGLFDFVEREFRGFREVKAIDADGNYSQTYFLQGAVDKGRPYLTELRDAAGKLYSQTKNTWETKTLYPGVFFPALSKSESFSYEGLSPPALPVVSVVEPPQEGTVPNFRYQRSTFTYDDFGNPAKVTTEVNSSQDPQSIADRKTQVTEYTYNTTDWLLSTPKHAYLLDSANNKISEKWLYYDQGIDLSAPPEKGLLTKEVVLAFNPLSQQNSQLITQYGYDEYGNLISTTDPLGRSTTTAYDSLTKSYPVKLTNALGHTIETVYYGINEGQGDSISGSGLPGQVKSTQDANQQKTCQIYDSFGRLSKVIGPKDSLALPAALYEYDLSNLPVTLIKKTKPNYEANPEDYYYSYSFFDGFGRAIYSASVAEADPQTQEPRQVVSGLTRYNTKGQPIEKYLPYFRPERADYLEPDYSLPHSSLSYDSLGRVTEATNPDLSRSSSIYSLWSVANIDPNGHKTAKHFDAWGRIIRVEEFTGADSRSKDYPYQPYEAYSSTKLTALPPTFTIHWATSPS